MNAVILAGGQGTRLQPYTFSLPKPLMPVGDKPILEILINKIRNAGIRKVYFAVGYLESLIRACFGDGSKYGLEIIYSLEREPLGTAGPLGLLKSHLNETFLFVNGDILTDMDIHDLIQFHREQKAAATIGITKRKVEIDFGVIKIDPENRFKEWSEKPTIDYFVSMGIYVLEPEVIDFIPKGYFNITDLIMLLNKNKKSVLGYLYKGIWLDIGRFEDYQEACRIVKNTGHKFE